MNGQSPIFWVKDLKTNQVYTNIPAPSSYGWEEADSSASDAGRTEDNVMHKKRIGQVEKLNLSWRNINTAKANIVLKAFNSEYVLVKFADPLAGTAANGWTNEIEFYVGDRHANLYSWELDIWSDVSFNLIDRRGVMKT